jgi:hypothetical protein
MSLMRKNMHSHGRKTCAKKPTIRALLQGMRNWVRPPNHPHIRDIDPRRARDIGLSEGDMAQHWHRYPSQHTHHPRS